ncbi:negative cofactor 2 complex subunit alpha-like [Impatiens glandulifera]|uniref:negative cofactor 2 complex subunit alpha-like n=1 Tax=Impatiens glandulifera TaxID=253017 RepID=UPI001FB0D7B9|nr:negative cofactor 2 complex subunit alpha-like [Impatiens glandulifera]
MIFPPLFDKNPCLIFEARRQSQNPTMAGEGEEDIAPTNLKTSFPTGRVKRIMKLDNEINKINSEALFLITSSADLFLKFLAEKSGQVAIEKKRKTVNLEHLRTAVENHQPTNDFLLDSLPISSQPLERAPVDRNKTRHADLAPPPGTRRIDQFFKKSS